MPAKKPENKKCPNCGACQECGHGGTQYVPYPVYPYYPWWSVTSYTQPAPYTNPGIQPNKWTVGSSGGTYTVQNTTGGNYQ